MKGQDKNVSMAEIAPMMEGLLADGMDVDFTPTGGSMRPLWRHRKDVIRLSAVDITAIKKWDVLLFRRNQKDYVLHRVVSVGEDTLDFLGDAQFHIERHIPKSNVVAKAVGYSRGGGRFRDMDYLPYRIYVWLWLKSYGLRYFFFRIYYKLKKIFGAVK